MADLLHVVGELPGLHLHDGDGGAAVVVRQYEGVPPAVPAAAAAAHQRLPAHGDAGHDARAEDEGVAPRHARADARQLGPDQRALASSSPSVHFLTAGD